MDDNRLTSWQWTFNGINILRIYAGLIAGVFVAYLLAKISFHERYPALFLFFLSSGITLPFWREPEVIVDAARYFTQAKSLELYGAHYFLKEWGRDIMAWTDMPVIPFLYGLIFRCIGESRIYIQILTTLFFSSTVVLTFMIGKRLWNEEVGLMGGLLLLAIPYLLTQVPLMLVDVPCMFLLTLLIFAFIRTLSAGGAGMIALSSVAVFLALFSKYSIGLMLSVIGVIFAVYLKKAPMVTFRRGMAVVTGAFLLIGAAYFLKADVISEQIRLLLSYQRPGLNRWGESFLSTFLFQVHPFVTAAALYSVYAALRKRDLRYVIICWAMFLIVLFQIRRIRYIVPAFPMLALMASYGIQEIKDRELKRFVVLSAVISSLIVAVFAYLPFLRGMSDGNLKQAGEFLDSLHGEVVEVFTLSQSEPVMNPAVSVPILDLFTQKRILYHGEVLVHPTQEEIEKSPLRFTWEYKTPKYYTGHADSPKERIPIILITNQRDELLSVPVVERIKGYRATKLFHTDEGIFLHKTFVTVYLPEGDRCHGEEEIY